MKIFYLDIETTGVKFWKNGIHQISGAIEIDDEVKEYFNFHVKPYSKALIEDEALAVSGITREDLKEYAEFRDVYDEIVSMCGRYVEKYNKRDKFFIVGYNAASFDNPFFRAFFKQNGDEYYGSWFWSNPILDVINIAGEYLKYVRPNMVDFKLKTVAKELGIEVDETKLHDARYDIDLTRAIYKKVTATGQLNSAYDMGFADAKAQLNTLIK